MTNPLPLSVAEALEKADRKHIVLAGIGCFSQAIKVADTGFVIKKPEDHPVVGNLELTEKRIYERLAGHPFILRYYGELKQGNGLPNRLVFEYHGAGTLAENLALSKYPQKRLKWPQQAAEALRYIHSKNVIHNDIGSHNFLIQDDGSLALADFGGSVIDDSPASVSYSTRYARPVPITDESNTAEIDDLFALGTVIYEIAIGQPLFADKSNREVRKLLHQRDFPDLDVLEMIPPKVKKTIQKCWANAYSNAEEVLCDLNMRTTYSSSMQLEEIV